MHRNLGSCSASICKQMQRHVGNLGHSKCFSIFSHFYCFFRYSFLSHMAFRKKTPIQSHWHLLFTSLYDSLGCGRRRGAVVGRAEPEGCWISERQLRHGENLFLILIIYKINKNHFVAVVFSFSATEFLGTVKLFTLSNFIQIWNFQRIYFIFFQMSRDLSRKIFS